MLNIFCKKCKDNTFVQDKRFKNCEKCRASKNKKNKIISQTNTSTENIIKYVYFLIPEICSYLTITEINNFSLTSKENRELLNRDKDWTLYIKRDYNIIYNIIVNQFENIPVPVSKFAIAIDSCEICQYCYKVTCLIDCINRKNRNIYKTYCKKYYKLSDEELNTVPCHTKYNNLYKKYVTVFKHSDIKKIVCIKYFGYKNFEFQRAKLDEEIRIKRENRYKKIQEEYQKFLTWKDETYNMNIEKYHSFSRSKRQQLLQAEIESQNITDLPFYDMSGLMINFINGYKIDFSTEKIVSIMKILLIFQYLII